MKIWRCAIVVNAILKLIMGRSAGKWAVVINTINNAGKLIKNAVLIETDIWFIILPYEGDIFEIKAWNAINAVQKYCHHSIFSYPEHLASNSGSVLL